MKTMTQLAAEGRAEAARLSGRPDYRSTVDLLDAMADALGAGYLSVKGLAAYSGISVRTLRARIAHKTAPLPHYRVGAKVLVKPSEFDEWMRQFKVTGIDAQAAKTRMDRLVEDAVRGILGTRTPLPLPKRKGGPKPPSRKPVRRTL